ncbi:MAG: helix-turn-helix domain-containing protein [Bacteroidales bacterium]|nr:helix-turn-helix domain-containing protein [Lachnoclostridium sp.]MCM1385268.1 helix-turn-helix domain-containing protein [Lachnoclostridium sp.]MCM1466146.1 helix-turn-helix domain-containing protein [Bacteroidales bacterium]
MTLYERLEDLRKSRKISQADLEKELGFSNGSISKWKKSSPTPERLLKFAQYFGVSMEYLLTGEEINPKSIINDFPTSELEKEIIRKFRQLNNDKQEMVILMLQIEQKGDVNARMA